MQSKWKKAPNRNLSFMTSCNLFLLHDLYWQVSNFTLVFTINCNYYNSQQHLTQRLQPSSPHNKDFTSWGIHLQTPACISYCESNHLHSTLNMHSKLCDLHCLKNIAHCFSWNVKCLWQNIYRYLKTKIKFHYDTTIISKFYNIRPGDIFVWWILLSIFIINCFNKGCWYHQQHSRN